ncbi:MAG TPA: D-alanyl-D-alanine carboxypeptidase/D-alanyl-D-alanine-endopeptidase, partial [Acidobacteriaceae bacterium]
MRRKRGWSAVVRGCAAVVLAVVCAVPAMGVQHKQVAAARHPKTRLAATIQTLLADPKIEGAHWGISVTRMDGTPVYALNDQQLFQPASNVKLFTTAAALGLLGVKATFETTVEAVGVFAGAERYKGDLYLYGHGDANLSGRAIPYTPNTDEKFPPLRYLDDLAAQVAQSGLKTIDGDIYAISTPAKDEPYGEGWNLDDLPWGYGAPVSMLSINDNQLRLTITPTTVSERAAIEIVPSIPYYNLQNDVMTVDGKAEAHIQIERVQGSKTLRVYGTIGLTAAPDVEHISIDDPAEFAGLALKQLLEQHGVAMEGRVIANHMVNEDARSFREISHEPLPGLSSSSVNMSMVRGLSSCSAPCVRKELARHVSPTLLDDVIVTNKVSQNLHA